MSTHEFEHRFDIADEFLRHTDLIIRDVQDPFIQQRYVGFIAVSAVTVYELAIKDILFRFSDRQHAVLGALSRGFFERMNGRISLQDLRKNHVPKFGQTYANRFDHRLDQRENDLLIGERRSMKSAYTNVIQWRHSFAHAGEVPTTTNYEEVKASYVLGKQVIYCLHDAFGAD